MFESRLHYEPRCHKRLSIVCSCPVQFFVVSAMNRHCQTVTQLMQLTNLSSCIFYLSSDDRTNPRGHRSQWTMTKTIGQMTAKIATNVKNHCTNEQIVFTSMLQISTIDRLANE